MIKINLNKTIFFVALLFFTNSANSNETRELVIKKGFVTCGVSEGVVGFSSINKLGQWEGIDVDFCRAVAAAVLADSNKVKFIPVSQRDRLLVVKQKEVDLFSRSLNVTFNREVDTGNHAFIRTTNYAIETFMVRKSSKISSVYQLNNVVVCTTMGAIYEVTAREFFKKQNKKYSIITFRDWEETAMAYEQGRCDALIADVPFLHSFKANFKKPEDHVVLKQSVAKSPTSILVRYDDKNWYNIVTWIINALILAEESEVNSNNVDSMLLSEDIEIKKLLGKEGDFGKKLSLSNEWAYNIVKQVGNYEEIYERNLGNKSNLKIDRGYNKLWTKGGLMYSIPLK